MIKIVDCIYYNKTLCEHKNVKAYRCVLKHKGKCLSKKMYRFPPDINSPKFKRR